MISVTSAEANKILIKLNDERQAMIEQESSLSWFMCASTEKPEDNRPDYDMEQYHAQLNELEGKIRTVKHAVNIFNTTHKVPGFDMTIDEILVFIPQLNEKKRSLRYMSMSAVKQRQTISNTPVIDYRYANFDPAKAKEEYNRVSDLLAQAQLALDQVNTTEKMNIEID